MTVEGGSPLSGHSQLAASFRCCRGVARQAKLALSWIGCPLLSLWLLPGRAEGHRTKFDLGETWFICSLV